MSTKVALFQSQTQSLVMTPQLRQSLRLLQLSSLDLQAEIEKELLENPVLEVVEGSLWNKNYATIGNTQSETPIPDRSPTLTGHLMAQLREAAVSSRVRDIASFVIGNLDEHGYLCSEVEEITSATGTSYEEVWEAIKVVQSFEPTGVGARNLNECLLLQLDRLGKLDSLEARLLTVYAPLLAAYSLSVIAAKESIPVIEVSRAVNFLRKLDPTPGAGFNEQDVSWVIPDICVDKVDGHYVPYLNEAVLPRLRINAPYKKLSQKKGVDEDVKTYVGGQVQKASWILRCIAQRQATLLKVATALVHRHESFFEQGLTAMTPLSLAQIADEIGVHESTVSRAVANKFIQTPHGIFALKFFFTAKVKTRIGDISATAIKERIRRIVDEETPEAPLSDQQIVNMLARFNITIARRTVGKYRDALHIAPAESRRERKVLHVAQAA